MFKDKKLRNTFWLAVLICAYWNSVTAQKDSTLKYRFSFYKYRNPKKVKYLHIDDNITVYLKTLQYKGEKQIINNAYGYKVKPDSATIDISYNARLHGKNDSVLSIQLDGEKSQITEYTLDTSSSYIHYKKGEPIPTDSTIGSGPAPVWKNDTVIRYGHEDTVIYSSYITETKDVNFNRDSILRIDFNKIDYVTYENWDDFTNGYFNFGLLCVSFASALVVAPAVSIDYAHGGFYPHRYFDIVIPSLSLFSVDLTLYLVMNRERKYKVKFGLR